MKIRYLLQTTATPNAPTAVHKSGRGVGPNVSHPMQSLPA